MKKDSSYAYLLPLISLLSLFSCINKRPQIIDPEKPKRKLLEYFDKKYLLYRLPDNFYNGFPPDQSLTEMTAKDVLEFKPLGYDPKLCLQYTHVYSKYCVYHKADWMYKFAEVCFPNTCLTKDYAYAEVKLRNSSNHPQNYFTRVFYQNTSYWYRTDSLIYLDYPHYLTNYYGASRVAHFSVRANSDTIVKVPYTIGLNPKHEFDKEPLNDPARPGNYEFMLLTFPDTVDLLMKETLNLSETNPFAEIQKDKLRNDGRKYPSRLSYVSPRHFKFVFLEEFFDGANDTVPKHIYIPKDRVEKKLCDTCTNWYRGVISEHWNTDDFFKGFLTKARSVKAEYGNRIENFKIDTNGVTLTIPKSRRGDYQKTWGEFTFGQSFKYGHLTVRAKFAQMFNDLGLPNGIIHNLWLYQRDTALADASNPYHYMVNSNGEQPFEIDFEIWSSQDNVNTPWDDNAFINYAIVDYMRNPNVEIKPGDFRDYENQIINRSNNRQLNIPGKNLHKTFFNKFHTYELYWYPETVVFLVDGVKTAEISKHMAKIPDEYMFLWIGSPLYQDGTYYAQPEVPFLKFDKRTIIDYIKIE